MPVDGQKQEFTPEQKKKMDDFFKSLPVYEDKRDYTPAAPKEQPHEMKRIA